MALASCFVLTTNLLGWRHVAPSAAEAFRSARAASDRLLACLAVEEAYAILVANYISFEKAVAAANIENMIEGAAPASDLHSRRREIDRHLVNLLAAGQMFTDHVRRRLTRGYGRNSSELKILDSALERQRQRLVGFWATECLRDAVLHHSLPVTSWTTGSAWVGTKERDEIPSDLSPIARLEHSVTFAFDPELLALDRKVNGGLISKLRERADTNGQVSWVPTIREYIEALSMVLDEVRASLRSSELEASEILRDLENDYRSNLPGGTKQPHYVFIVERDSSGRWLDSLPLNLGLEHRISELRQQHRPIINLHRRALSG